MTKMVSISLRISEDVLNAYTKQAKRRTQKVGKKISVQEIIRESLTNLLEDFDDNSQDKLQKELLEKIYVLAKINSELLIACDDSEDKKNRDEAVDKGTEALEKIKHKYNS